MHMHQVKIMKKQSRGIVLFKKGDMVSMIDEIHGRFLATTFRDLMIGALYVYDVIPYGKRYTLSQEELVSVPFEMIQSDIVFFHHILEICLFFAPLGSCVEGVFQLLLQVYNEPCLWLSYKSKKFLVFKILASLGVWPSQILLNKQFLQVAEIPIDRINAEILDLVPEKEIELWIQYAFAQDPMFAKMKTKIFLESIYHND